MIIVLLTTLIFFSAATILFFLFYALIPKKSIVKERLETMIPETERMSSLEKPVTSWQRLLSGLGRKVKLRPKDYGKYTRMLVAAGIKKERYPVFMGTKLLLAAVFPVAYLLFYGLPIEKEMTMKIICTVVAGIAGFLLPSLWVQRKMKNRQRAIFHDLPDLLDLMTVCVEAGLSMDSAMIKVYEDHQFRRSPLASEMKIAIQETRAGKPRLDALRDMGERSMVDDLKSFSAMLIQTERLGTSLAHTMRVFSDSLRTVRRQRAEEAAAKTAVKLIFPLVFFIFPALLIVILGPGFLRIFEVLGQ